MNEAKQLVQMAITALAGVLILAAAMGLITLGYLMWGAFSSQAAANRRLQEYSKYSAFDGTEVRGQDVIALLHETQGSPYVIIVERPTAGTTKPLSVIFSAVSADDTLSSALSATPGMASDVNSMLVELLGGSTTTVMDLANKVEVSMPGGTSNYYKKSELDKTKGKFTFNFSTSASAPNYSELQSFFLQRGATVSAALHGSGEAGYLPYKSYLLYDGDDSTDIIGILLVEKQEITS